LYLDSSDIFVCPTGHIDLLRQQKHKNHKKENTMKTRDCRLSRDSGLGMLLVLATIIFLLNANALVVAADSPLNGSMTSFLVEKNEAGEEVLSETAQVKPGQTIEYALVYANVSTADLTDVNILGPIPEGTMYLAGTAMTIKDLVPLFSIDGGVVFKTEPLSYMVKQADGSEIERIATPDMYTHIRWNLANFAAQQKLTLRYRVKVK